MKRLAYMSDEEFEEYAWNKFKKEFLIPLLAFIAITLISILFFGSLG